MRRPTTPLTDLQAAVAEFAGQQIRGLGKSIDEVLAQVTAGGALKVTKAELAEWMRLAKVEGQDNEPDPLRGEQDEVRRAEKMDSLIIEAAATIPGASDLIGLERLVENIREAEEGFDALSHLEKIEVLREVIVDILDFLVPNVMSEALKRVQSTVHIPPGGRWEVWSDGSRNVMASTLAVFDEAGALYWVHLRTRARGKAYERHRRLCLPVYAVRFRQSANLHGVMQRVVQICAEFRRQRHGHITQVELAAGVGRTKQAISHQRLGITRDVTERTGGRAGYLGVRNLRPRGKAK